jgi:hypothetical protein
MPENPGGLRLILDSTLLRRGGLAVAAMAGTWIIIACAGPSQGQDTSIARPPNTGVPAFATRPVDLANVPTAVSLQSTSGEPTMIPGMHLEDNCVAGRLPSQPGTGQIIGQGVNVIIEVDTTLTFSRAVAETAAVACRPNVGRAEVERLVGTLNGLQGARVRTYNWPGG